MPEFTDDMTLAEARELLRELAEDGERCPCCTQNVKIYKRKIHASMARALIAIYAESQRRYEHFVHGGPRGRSSEEWIEISTILPHNQVADAAKLRYWGLIEEEPAVRDDGSARTGFWRITSRGIAFVRDSGVERKYVRLYNGRRLGVEGDLVSIRDCLGKKFRYDELMAGV